MDGSYGGHMFNFLKKLPNCSPKFPWYFTFLPAVYENSSALLLMMFSKYSCPYVLYRYLIYWSICSNIFAHFFLLGCFLSIELWGLFIYSRHKSFIRYVLCKYFFPVYGLSLHSLNIISKSTLKFLNFHEVHNL